VNVLLFFKRTMSRPQCVDWQTLPTNAFHGDGQDAPCLTYPTVYVLRCQHGKFYVGLATAGCGVEQRWAKHIAGQGAQWVKEHKPIDVCDIYYPASKEMEKQVTMYYATLHGSENVRGGPWCNSTPPTQSVKRPRLH